VRGALAGVDRAPGAVLHEGQRGACAAVRAAAASSGGAAAQPLDVLVRFAAALDARPWDGHSMSKQLRL
jgi:hypothetical protein